MMDVLTDDGARLAWTTDGDPARPAVLLSNSLGTRWEMWDAVLAPLVERFHVIRYDSRGHGRSASPPGEYSMARLGADALAVLDAAQVARAHVVGISKGGMVGQWLGVHAPGRVNRLVLANTAAWMGPPEPWAARIETVRREGMAAIGDAVVERWFTPAFRGRSPDVVAGILDRFVQTSPLGYIGCCAAIRDMDQRPDVARITAATLVIGGLEDPATPPETAEALASLIPGSRLEMLAAAHLSNIEQPTDFVRLVVDFLEHDNG